MKQAEYGIQVTAVSSHAQAETWARILQEELKVKIVEEDHLFKVIVCGYFFTKKAAIEYQKRNNLLENGFVRILS